MWMRWQDPVDAGAMHDGIEEGPLTIFEESTLQAIKEIHSTSKILSPAIKHNGISFQVV